MTASAWNDDEARGYVGLLGQRVYSSRLLGRDQSLVLHGGGNTSVKIREPNLYGQDEDILYVKGSGWDLRTIEAAGFAPVRLGPVRRLLTLDRLSDAHMLQELRAAMGDPSAPTPSVETLLHAVLPQRFVDHTHADALLAITNTPDGARRVAEAYGETVVVVPYVMPGFDLARYVARHLPPRLEPSTIGLVLLNHGFFSFGETAREAYERMIELVSRAEAYLEAHGAWRLPATGRPSELAPPGTSQTQPSQPSNPSDPTPPTTHPSQLSEPSQLTAPTPPSSDRSQPSEAQPAGSQATPHQPASNAPTLPTSPRTHAGEFSRPITSHSQPSRSQSGRMDTANLRRQVSDAAGQAMLLSTHRGPHELAFVQRADLAQLATSGPATPDHVIRTKRLPQLGRDVAQFAADYARYFVEHSSGAPQPLTMLDPAPRVILDPQLGLVTIGRTAQDTAIAFDIYEHTIDIVLRATALGGYQALPANDIFAVEYWDLEQAKLRRPGAAPVFTGEIALVTGAASGIGKATVEALLRRGAAVIGLDLNARIGELFGPRADVLGLQCDVTDPEQIESALDAGVQAFGGLDMLVLNAGIFGASQRIADLPLDDWRDVQRVNLDANLALLSAAYPLLRCAPGHGRVVVIGSKNVPAPGAGAAAYSASKAALTQLARVAALEWGRDGIRVNVIHPNAVFDTALWTEDVLRSRAASYGLSVEDYRKNNVLGVEVSSRDVAEMAAEMCGPLFARTTAAQVPVDGGNERVI